MLPLTLNLWACYSNQSLTTMLRSPLKLHSSSESEGQQLLLSILLLVHPPTYRDVLSTKTNQHQIHQLNSCIINTLRLRQNLAPCRVAIATWKCCSEFTVLPLIFFVLQLLQLKTDAVSTALCCPHTDLKNSTAKYIPDLGSGLETHLWLETHFLPDLWDPSQLTRNADKWWKAAWQSPLPVPSAPSGGSHLAPWTCDSSGRVVCL